METFPTFLYSPRYSECFSCHISTRQMLSSLLITGRVIIDKHGRHFFLFLRGGLNISYNLLFSAEEATAKKKKKLNNFKFVTDTFIERKPETATCSSCTSVRFQHGKCPRLNYVGRRCWFNNHQRMRNQFSDIGALYWRWCLILAFVQHKPEANATIG